MNNFLEMAGLFFLLCVFIKTTFRSHETSANHWQGHQLVSVREQQHTGARFPGPRYACGMAVPVDARLFAIEGDFQRENCEGCGGFMLTHTPYCLPTRSPQMDAFQNRPSRRHLLAVPVVPAVFDKKQPHSPQSVGLECRCSHSPMVVCCKCVFRQSPK